MRIQKTGSKLSFALMVSVILSGMCAVNSSHAGQPLSDEEMRETAENLSASNLGGLSPDQMDYLQRENEQGRVVVPQTTMPMGVRQQSLIQGKLTPDQIREENMANSYRNGTRDYVPFSFF